MWEGEASLCADDVGAEDLICVQQLFSGKQLVLHLSSPLPDHHSHSLCPTLIPIHQLIDGIFHYKR